MLTEPYRLHRAQHVGDREVDDLTLKDFSLWLSKEVACLEKLYDPIVSKKTTGFIMATSEKSKETSVFKLKNRDTLDKCYVFLKIDEDKH